MPGYDGEEELARNRLPGDHDVFSINRIRLMNQRPSAVVASENQDTVGTAAS